MLITTNLWHPAGEARQYEAAGSRTSYNEKWNPHTPYSFTTKPISDAVHLMIEVLTDEQKERWLDSFDPAA